MTLLSEASCPWPVDLESCQLSEVNGATEVFEDSVAAASAIMARLSGYTIGLCETEIRPLSMCPECRSWCCGGSDSIYLPGPMSVPVWEVTRVRLGALEYDPTTWRFDRQTRMLYRRPPEVWPRRDEKWSEAGEGEAFVVDATIGTPPDAWALDVLARLVKELVLSCIGSKCRLPSNVTTVTSQGLSIRLRDNEINTFIPELGAWMNAVNPHNARLPGAVFSPDIATSHRGSSRSLGGCCGG